MIGKITTEVACAVTGTPFERTSQYLKRKQLVLEMDRAEPRPKTREWLVLDVMKLAALREMTDLGLSISSASELIKSKTLDRTMWEDLGCHALDFLTASDAPQWYILVTRSAASQEPTIGATNEMNLARSLVFPPTGPDSDNGSRVSIVINMTAIARDVRRKLEALGGSYEAKR